MTGSVLIWALAASLPVAAFGWLVGGVFDRLSNAPDQRHLLWTVAFHVPAVAAVFVTAATALNLSLFAPPAFGAARALTLAVSDYGEARVAGWSGVGLALALWTAGVAICVLRVARGLWRASLLAGRASAKGETARKALGIPVRFSPELNSALLVGLRRPVILLPPHLAKPENSEAADLVCRHEAAHASRSDNLRLCGEELLLAIFWFNPILHAVRRRLSASREELCDAIVVRGLDARERRLYADTLVEAFAARSLQLPVTGLLGLTRRNAAMRLSAILSPTPANRKPIVLAGLLVAMCSAGAAGAGFAREAASAPKVASQPIDISGQSLRVAKAADVQVWVGQPNIRGLSNRDDVAVRLDGRPVGKAFNFDSISQDSLAAIVVTQQADGKSMDVDLISLKPSAQPVSVGAPTS